MSGRAGSGGEQHARRARHEHGRGQDGDGRTERAHEGGIYLAELCRPARPRSRGHGDNDHMSAAANEGPPSARVTISRRSAWFLLVVALWMTFVWGTFIRNLANEEGRPTGFYVAHTVLIVVDLAIAAVLAVVAIRALRSLRRPD